MVALVFSGIKCNPVSYGAVAYGSRFSEVLLLISIAGLAASSETPVHHAPQPYKFGYIIKDKHGEQHREEVGNGAGSVKGSYGFTDDRGVHRQVDYVADKAGFRAQVKTNEPGTANQDPAAVKFLSSAPKVVDGPGLLANGLAVNSIANAAGRLSNGLAVSSTGNAANLQARSFGAPQLVLPAATGAIGNGLALNVAGLRNANNGLLLGGLGDNGLLGGLEYARYALLCYIYLYFYILCNNNINCVLLFQVLVLALAASFALASYHVPVHHAPKPYKFGYNIKDKHGDQYREEVGDGTSGVKGSYGFTDARGIHRQVDYVADHAGFRAQVKTNEPGTANQDPAAVKMISSAPYAGYNAGPFGAPAALGAGAEAGLLVERGLPNAGLVNAIPFVGLANGGLGFGGYGLGYNGYGLQQALLNTLGYQRYGY
ncbi:uncharacterized protein LOC129219947 [Uloborus diversus]|uniref:uncharacterized protein LOC129219947 n=1 Tax=Uloborus diversus TaxID=327109 RepID=UPI00240A5823|nr:uncharacterized protein LOC129219947 [Uloborus diversus]